MNQLRKQQLYFEDVEPHTNIPPLEMGPVSMTTIVKFAGASGDFAPIHHDEEVARTQGLAGPIIMGPLKWAYLSQLITDWAGPEGFLRQLDLRLTQIDLVGDALTAKGRVTAKYRDEDKNCIECEIWLENRRTGSSSVSGKALVYLPSRQE